MRHPVFCRRGIGEQPFQEYRFRITTITTVLSAAVITAGNHFPGNIMPTTCPGRKLHVPI